MLRYRDPPRSGRRQRRELCRLTGRHLARARREDETDRSTLACAAAATASALVMPQIFIHMAPSVAI